MNEQTIKQIAEDIIASADHLMANGKENLDRIVSGKLIGYAEALSIVRSACAGYDLQKIGLSFDPDERYLT